MNLRQFETFLAVADELSFTKAAKLLQMTQPAVSMQIKALEDELGVQVFERHERTVSLSPAGKLLRSEAETIVNASRRMRIALAEFKKLKRGTLKIGASSLPGEYLIAPVISRFRTRYPGVEVELSLGNTEQILQRVRERELDIGLVGALPESNATEFIPTSDASLEAKVWLTDQLILLVSCHHPLATEGQATIQDILQEKWLWREEGSGTRQVMEEALAKAGVRIAKENVTELASTRAIITAVAAGLGISLVSGFAAEETLILKRVVAVPIEGLNATRSIFAVRLNKRVDHPPESAFWSFLTED